MRQPVYQRLCYMQRRFKPPVRMPRNLIPATALLSVMLIMLMFYVAGSRFVLQPGVIVNLPASSFDTGAPYGPMVLTISQEGMIFFNDERTTLEGLEAVFAQSAHEHPEATLVIEADGRIQQNRIVGIYNMAMAAGIKKIALATRISSVSDTTK